MLMFIFVTWNTIKNDKKTNGMKSLKEGSDNQMKLKFKINMEANFLFTETQFVSLGRFPF